MSAVMQQSEWHWSGNAEQLPIAVEYDSVAMATHRYWAATAQRGIESPTSGESSRQSVMAATDVIDDDDAVFELQ